MVSKGSLLLFSLVLILTLQPTAAYSAYFVDGEVVGYRCTDWVLIEKCKEIKVIGYTHDGLTYRFKKDMGFESVTKFRKSGEVSTRGSCKILIGYSHKGTMTSKLFKFVVDKATQKYQTIGADGKPVTVDYVEFKCYKG